MIYPVKFITVPKTRTKTFEKRWVRRLTKSEKIIISTSQTDKNGNYQIGPLSSEEEYELKAEKEGFKLTKVDKSDFIAEKLSFLKIKTQDSNGKPLPGVILSLSSSEGGFSLNNRTNSEGVFNFIDLSSGEYYIKPLYKEYDDPKVILVLSKTKLHKL